MRGATVAGMILVNNPGSWTDGYGFLAHASWNGWTLADLIFPFFLLIVGISINFSLSGRLEAGRDHTAVFSKIFSRAVLLFVLGLVLNGFSSYSDLSSLRFFGVLQRIALCSVIASAIFLRTGPGGQVISTILLLAVYWLMMKVIAVPGYGGGVLEPQGNLAGYVDNFLFHGHLYHDDFDPEGLLSTIPAVATTLLGVLAGHWLRSSVRPSRKAVGLFVAGAVLGLAGEICDRWFPINKQLWSSSFVLLTGGLGLIFLGACYGLIDAKGNRRLTTPFAVLGSNALTVYLLSSLAAQLMELCQLSAGNETFVSLRFFLYAHLFAPWAGVRPGSFLFALAYLFLWLPPMAFLYQRKVFFRV